MAIQMWASGLVLVASGLPGADKSEPFSAAGAVLGVKAPFLLTGTFPGTPGLGSVRLLRSVRGSDMVLDRSVSQSAFEFPLQRRAGDSLTRPENVLLISLVSSLTSTEALAFTDPRLCYILDCFLGLYGLVITGMFIREKFFKTKVKGADDSIYSDLREPGTSDPERGRNRRMPEDSTYTDWKKQGSGEYKELPMKRERQKKNDPVYQGLSSATRDTYQSLQMQPLPGR
ncbi:T-cell surface glycoprotein CD3 zeta chain [Xenentodon cancila]